MKNIAIFASGDGSNAEAIAQYLKNDADICVKLVLSNRENAGVHRRMKQWGIPTITFSRERWKQCNDILEILKAQKIDLIVLAGFLCVIEPPIIDVYAGNIINIHPSLLPKFGGHGMWGSHVHKAVIASGETESGITIHYVTNEVDGGKIIFQTTCPVLPDDTPEALAERIHCLEHEYYPQIISQLLK
ncbi:MAG: phosphoribosylglycinamide formyltransferase [Muribaculaceae bacterium]|nr:phosphoribosylglycinamide formyltransferase [Muribaculaceae bacterium]